MQLLHNFPTSLQNILQKWSVFFIYLFINALFVIKYGGQFSFYLLLFYLLFIFAVTSFYFKIDLKTSVYKYLFWIGLGLFFTFSIGVNYYVDGKSLNVDRWDAMEVGIKAIFNNEYPYNIEDYLGRESSNLPFLVVLGMPLYAIFGSVGFMQSFSFVIPLIILLLKTFYKFSVKEKIRFISVFVLVASFLLYLFFRNAANWETIVEHNPFAIQGSKQPVFLSISYIVLVIILAFKVRSFFDVSYWSAIVLFVAVFIPYLLHLVEYGYENVMVNSYFDLSFFNMSMPFLIVSLIYILKKNLNINKK